MKKLLVLANEFPYGTMEPYMETEEEYYSRFDKVWIASLQLRKAHEKTIRSLKSGARVIPVKYKSRLFYLFNSLTILFDSALYREMSLLRKQRRLSFGRIVDLFVFLSRAHHEARVINRALKSESKDEILIYSYRFEYQPYVAVLLKKKWKRELPIVTRAHRYDLYEDQHKNDYIPLRAEILDSVDRVYPCSKQGSEYISSHYGNHRAVVETSYLGTKDYGYKELELKDGPKKIVSCSTAVPVKRLDLIIGALSKLSGVEIEWTHFGDGPLLDEVKELAKEKLGANVKVRFMGNLPNTALLEQYRNTEYHVFLNTSSSEGLPVSIMEAASFGIPCVATDVGGTKELVNENTGKLIPENADESEVAKAVENLLEMDREEYAELRKKTRAYWGERFNAGKNYAAFVDRLLAETGGRKVGQ